MEEASGADQTQMAVVPDTSGSAGSPAREDEGQESFEAAEAALPSVETLVQRLSPGVNAALDELFRVRWTGVKRLRAGDLKTG